jgi:adenosine deaminase
MYSKKDVTLLLKLIKLDSNLEKKEENKEKNIITKDKKFFDFIVVDLLLGDYNEGNQIINNLVNFRHIFNRQCQEKEERTYFDIIALSLSEEAHDISRALNEGSLYYVHKSRPYMLPAVIAQLEKGREILEQRERDKIRPQKARIFGKLYRLPEIIKRRLKSDDKFIQNLNNYLKIPAYEWIKKMPKADLHFHLGGSIPLDSVFFLSLNMLTDIQEKDLLCAFEKVKNFIFKILAGDWKKFLDLFKIMEKIKNKPDEIKSWLKSIKEQKGNYFDNFLPSQYKTGEKKSIEEIFFQILECIINQCDNDKAIPSFQAVNMFNVLIGILEGKGDDDIEEFWKQLKILKTLEIDFETVSQKAIIRNCFLGLDIETIDSISKKSKKTLNDIKKNIPKQGKAILNHFVSAKVRKTSSLDEYLSGNRFIGAEQLQKKENILAALYLIIKRNIEDNVRYLEIRLSPDGYTENKNLTMQEAINALLEYTDLITCYFYQRGKFIRVNYVFCVKRHKPPDQAAIEISAAIANRERENKFKDITPAITTKNIETLKYQWKPSKVVGVDLAGIEKENPASKFINDFFPLFKTSFFITVHAGEEDTAQSIWEAIYLLHANRIGHGLTLKDYKYLTELFRDLQICIEMNPISNLLTNKDIENEYPFYDFVAKGIKVTINTDNQSVSESTLSEEYIKAAELYQNHRNNRKGNWISKWDILRVIKNGFGSAFLDREEKRNLMRAVEEEIYQEIIEEYGC